MMVWGLVNELMMLQLTTFFVLFFGSPLPV